MVPQLTELQRKDTLPPDLQIEKNPHPNEDSMGCSHQVTILVKTFALVTKTRGHEDLGRTGGISVLRKQRGRAPVLKEKKNKQ